ILYFEQQLPGGRRWDRGFLQAEVGQLRPALGAGGEDDLAGSHVDISRRGFPHTGCFDVVVSIRSFRRRERSAHRLVIVDDVNNRGGLDHAGNYGFSRDAPKYTAVYRGSLELRTSCWC